MGQMSKNSQSVNLGKTQYLFWTLWKALTFYFSLTNFQWVKYNHISKKNFLVDNYSNLSDCFSSSPRAARQHVTLKAILMPSKSFTQESSTIFILSFLSLVNFERAVLRLYFFFLLTTWILSKGENQDTFPSEADFFLATAQALESHSTKLWKNNLLLIIVRVPNDKLSAFHWIAISQEDGE